MSRLRRKQPTIVDIAAHAGVAPMTVSRVINKSGYASQDARDRVLAAIKELNYHPNALARGLKRQRTHVVGIMLPDIANPFSAVLTRAIQEVLAARGYNSFIATAEGSVAREQDGLAAFFDHRVDGILVATRGTPAGDQALIGLADRGVPIVTIGRQLMHASVDRVTADHRKGGCDAVEHLISLGHTRIAFLGVTMENGRALRRFQGYLDALRKHGAPARPELVVGPQSSDSPGYSTQADGYDGLCRLMSLKNPPRAIFARNDYAAIGAMCAARDLGLHIPDDVAIAGFDNVPIAAYTTPPLTTVDQPTAEQGRLAAEFLIDRMEGREPAERREVCLECSLVVRASTAGATPANATVAASAD